MVYHRKYSIVLVSANHCNFIGQLRNWANEKPVTSSGDCCKFAYITYFVTYPTLAKQYCYCFYFFKYVHCTFFEIGVFGTGEPAFRFWQYGINSMSK